MKRFISFVFCLFFLVACDKDSDVPEVPVQYVLKDIVYSLEDGDGVQDQVEDQIPTVVTNSSNSMMTVSITGGEGSYNSSLFESIDPNAFLLEMLDSVFVMTPSSIENGVIVKGCRFLYTIDSQRTSPTSYSVTTVSLNPYCRLTAREQVNCQYMRVTYMVTFENKVTREQKTAKGKWHGRVYMSTNSKYTTEEIK